MIEEVLIKTNFCMCRSCIPIMDRLNKNTFIRHPKFEDLMRIALVLDPFGTTGVNLKPTMILLIENF
jgi:hypothetical protein